MDKHINNVQAIFIIILMLHRKFINKSIAGLQSTPTLHEVKKIAAKSALRLWHSQRNLMPRWLLFIKMKPMLHNSVLDSL